MTVPVMGCASQPGRRYYLPEWMRWREFFGTGSNDEGDYSGNRAFGGIYAGMQHGVHAGHVAAVSSRQDLDPFFRFQRFCSGDSSKL